MDAEVLPDILAVSHSHDITLSRSRRSETLGLQLVDPLIQLRQSGGNTVLRGSRSGHNALQGQAGQFGDVAGTVGAIVRFEDFVLHLGEAEADHLSFAIGIRHGGELQWGRQDTCSHPGDAASA